MRISPFKNMRTLLYASLLVCAFGGVFIGCKRITSNDVSGVYIRSSNGVADTILLATNGIFHQTITFTNGQQWSKTGSWSFAGEIVEFDTFYLAFDVPDFKYSPEMVIPPKALSMEELWVEKGRLSKRPDDLPWLKQEKGSHK